MYSKFVKLEVRGTVPVKMPSCGTPAPFWRVGMAAIYLGNLAADLVIPKTVSRFDNSQEQVTEVW